MDINSSSVTEPKQVCSKVHVHYSDSKENGLSRSIFLFIICPCSSSYSSSTLVEGCFFSIPSAATTWLGRDTNIVRGFGIWRLYNTNSFKFVSKVYNALLYNWLLACCTYRFVTTSNALLTAADVHYTLAATSATRSQDHRLLRFYRPAILERNLLPSSILLRRPSKWKWTGRNVKPPEITVSFTQPAQGQSMPLQSSALCI